MNETPNDKDIRDLKDLGYSVHLASDGDPPLYCWMQRGGASQSDYKHLQPFRRSEKQAWADCAAYAYGSMPTKPEPDWVTTES